VNWILTGDAAGMGAASLEKIRSYTLENMAQVHATVFREGISRD